MSISHPDALKNISSHGKHETSRKHSLPRDKEKFRKTLKEVKHNKEKKEPKEQKDVSIPLHSLLFDSKMEIGHDKNACCDEMAVVALSALEAREQHSFETALAVTKTTSSAYDRLHPEVLNLFEKMVAEMIVMNSSSVTHTIISLNSPSFSSSIFFGTKIMISEYSSAPKLFNIQLMGSPAAQAVFQKYAGEMMKVFESRTFDFQIHRMEWSFDENTFDRFQRKDPVSADKEKDQ